LLYPNHDGAEVGEAVNDGEGVATNRRSAAGNGSRRVGPVELIFGIGDVVWEGVRIVGVVVLVDFDLEEYNC